MARDIFARSEEAAGISTPEPKYKPYGKSMKDRVAQGGAALPYTGPRPWKDTALIPRAKGGRVTPSFMKKKGSALSRFMPKDVRRTRRGKKRGTGIPL